MSCQRLPPPRDTFEGMSTAEVAVASASADAGATGRFVGNAKAFWGLLARGAVLLMLTLGLYRFWLTTDVRRFLWANTELDGGSFEYTGTARELLLGFLIAIAVLVPLYAAFFLIALAFGDAFGSVLGFLILTFLGPYAVYRARRYRLTRTIYRGVRFHQTGSAWGYAVCAVLWWSLTFITLGLAYPFAQSQLERFKMRNTFFGDLPGSFHGSGLRLLLRGSPLWALAIVPFVAGVIASILALNESAFTPPASGSELGSWLEASGLASAMVFAGLTLAWLVLCLAVLYPLFQTIVLRWWISGLRFGEVGLQSRLRLSQVFAVYARFVGFAALFSLAAGLLVLVGILAVQAITGGTDSLLGEIVNILAMLVAYVAIALGYSTIYQATVKLGLWRSIIESLDVRQLALLDKVTGAGEPASPFGEGLADALNVGGL
jgi:uncharacterized membrane protein YjgN (DUF898 family)